MSEYEDGDINQIDDRDDDHDDDVVEVEVEVDDAVCLEVTEYIVKALATEADAVEVTSNHRSGVTKLSVSVAPDDMGRLIGRRGRTAQALRTLVGVAGAQAGVKTNVDIIDD